MRIFFFYLLVSSASLFFTFNLLNKAPCDYRIAVLIPSGDDRNSKIVSAFKDGFDDLPVEFLIFDGRGSANSMKDGVKKISEGGFDLVFSVGPRATRMLYLTLAASEDQIPIVFADISYPDDLLGSDDKYPIAGAIEDIDITKKLSFIPKEIKSLLLVYDPTNWGMKQDIEKFSRVAEQREISIKKVEILNTSDMNRKVPLAIDSVDALLILKDSTVLPGVKYLSSICKKYAIPLITSDLCSFDRGADISIGVVDEKYGEVAANLAKEILSGNSHNSVTISDFEVLGVSNQP